MNYKLKGLLAISSLLGAPLLQSSSLDTAFGPTSMPPGTVQTPFPDAMSSVTTIANSVAIQADGSKVIAAGLTYQGSGHDIAVARYDSTDGSLDTTFGTGGRVTTVLPSIPTRADAVAVDENNNVFVAGFADKSTHSEFIIVKYDSTGMPDASFGPNADGTVTKQFGTSPTNQASAIKIDSAGNIFVAGLSFSALGLNEFAILKLDSSGMAVSAFGPNGDGTVTIPFSGNAAINGIACDGTDIVVAGYAHNSIDDDFAVAKLDATGMLVPTFGTGGIVTTPIGTGSSDRAKGLIVQGDSIILGGFSSDTSGIDQFAAAKYDKTTGALDGTFGTGGIKTTLIGSSSKGEGIAALGIDKFVISGYLNSPPSEFAVAVYKSTDGSLDETFNSAGTTPGIETTTFGTGTSRALQVASLGNQIFLAGDAVATTREFALAKYIGTAAPPSTSGQTFQQLLASKYKSRL